MEDLPAEEARRLLRSSRFGHIGLARNDRAYVLPIFYAYDGEAVYFHSHPGEKVEFLEGTEQACLAVSHVESEDVWMSVLVYGTVDRVQLTDEQLAAMDATSSLPPPPELGTSEHGEPRRSLKDTFFWKLTPERITGRKSERPLPEGTFDVG